jgi:hypothetical protein
MARRQQGKPLLIHRSGVVRCGIRTIRVVLRIPSDSEWCDVILEEGGTLECLNQDIQKRAVHDSWDLKLRHVCFRCAIFGCRQLDLDRAGFPSSRGLARNGLLSGSGVVETLVLVSSAKAVEVSLLEVFMEHHIVDDRVKVAIQFDSGSQIEPTH